MLALQQAMWSLSGSQSWTQHLNDESVLPPAGQQPESKLNGKDSERLRQGHGPGRHVQVLEQEEQESLFRWPEQKDALEAEC